MRPKPLMATRRVMAGPSFSFCLRSEFFGLVGGRAGRVAHRLDIVSVGVEDKRCVVIRVIAAAETRGAVVAASGGQRGPIERIDIGAFRGRESEVQRTLD